MQTVVLDFSDWLVTVISHVWVSQLEDVEEILFSKELGNFTEDSIKWMTMESFNYTELVYDTKRRTLVPIVPEKTVCFTIWESEIAEHSDKRLSSNEMDTILQLIENDEVLWSDIEEAKEYAIQEIHTARSLMSK